MIKDGRYYFAIHTHQKYSFAKSIFASHYNKVEVSNIPQSGNNLIGTSDALFANDEYNTTINTPIEKLEFFQQRSNKTLHISKAK